MYICTYTQHSRCRNLKSPNPSKGVSKISDESSSTIYPAYFHITPVRSLHRLIQLKESLFFFFSLQETEARVSLTKGNTRDEHLSCERLFSVSNSGALRLIAVAYYCIYTIIQCMMGGYIGAVLLSFLSYQKRCLHFVQVLLFHGSQTSNSLIPVIGRYLILVV
jgi:hypothetical protein